METLIVFGLTALILALAAGLGAFFAILSDYHSFKDLLPSGRWKTVYKITCKQAKELLEAEFDSGNAKIGGRFIYPGFATLYVEQNDGTRQILDKEIHADENVFMIDGKYYTFNFVEYVKYFHYIHKVFDREIHNSPLIIDLTKKNI